MRFLGKLFLFLVFAAVVSGVYYFEVLNKPLPNFFPTPNSNNQSTTSLYRNQQYLFEVEYSKQYTLSTEDLSPNYFRTGGVSVASISIPSSIYPNTNFGSATASIAVKEDSTEVDCSTYVTSANASKRITTTDTVNGKKFFVDQFTGAAAGTKYDTKLYRILRDTTCYEWNLTVGIGNIGNFEPGAVTEVTLEQIMPRLDAIVSRFNFVSPSAAIDPTAEGTLEGNVKISSQSSADIYDLTQVVVYSEDRSKIISRLDLNQRGEYFIDLPVGIYYVTYTTVSTRIQPPMQKVTITKGETVTQDFSID